LFAIKTLNYTRRIPLTTWWSHTSSPHPPDHLRRHRRSGLEAAAGGVQQRGAMAVEEETRAPGHLPTCRGVAPVAHGAGAGWGWGMGLGDG